VKRRWAIPAGFALVCAALASCSTTTGPSAPAADASPIATRAVTGEVDLPEGVTIDLAELRIVSFAGSADVAADGSFSLVVPDVAAPQVLLAMGDGTVPVMLGYVTPYDTEVVIDAASTALALVLLNPFTTMFSAEDRDELVYMVESKDWWPELVARTESVLGMSGGGRLDGELEPALLQLASGIAIDVLDDWPGGGLSAVGPWFEDAAGGAVSVFNPGVAYCAATFRADSGDSLVALLDSDRDGIQVHPGWPPFVDIATKTRTYVDLGDGAFTVTFTRGDLSTLDPGTANGIAGLRNAGRGITELLALASGVSDSPDPLSLDLTNGDCSEMAARVRASDTVGLVRSILELASAEAGRISEWYWGEENEDAETYVRTVCPLLSGIAFSTSVLAPGETRIPFYSSLAGGPRVASQSITQVDGVLVTGATQAAPRADFSVSPPGARPGVLMVFDASESYDPDGAESELEVRWDWGNDGMWDTTWTTVKVVGHGFASAGAHEVALQARDRNGLADIAVHVVNVGGGADSASHVVVLRDMLPWSGAVPAVLDQMLEVMGFEPGPGAGQYSVVSSSAIDTLTLRPGVDLVIVQSDQPQRFYDGYAASQVRMQRFVRDGGTIFWEACDRGWNGGSIENAGIVLPGDVDLVPYETWYNYVALPGEPIVAGLPSFLYGQYASHAGIANLPDGAVPYITDDDGQPTLVEFSYGAGWVIMTTQPLEWNFYNNWTSGAVMPHVVSYVVGVPLIHDFGDIVKPDQRGRPRMEEGAGYLTSGIH